MQTTFADLFSDKQSAINCVESIGNDIILDRPKKYLNWTEKQYYYSTSDITEINTMFEESDIVKYIEKRTETVQQVFTNFFFE